MYNIDFSNIKKERKTFYILFGFGIVFFIIMILILGSHIIKMKSMDSEVMSHRVSVKSSSGSEGETMYSPVYYYKVNGKEYACSSSSSSTSYPNTENAIVKYNSNNPSSCVSKYTENSMVLLIVFMIIPIILLGVSIFQIRKINKKIKALKELNMRGKLIKGLTYRLVDSHISINDVPLKVLVVDYTLPNGNKIELKGDSRFDRKLRDEDGLVDLLIDESNPSNYFIDFEIKPLSSATNNSNPNGIN